MNIAKQKPNKYQNLNLIFDIVFVASSRDYHAMDWYRTVRNLMPQKKIAVATDLIEGEGVKSILKSNDIILQASSIDKYLFKQQSHFGNLWRNLIKLFFAIKFAFFLRKLAQHKKCIFHAHSMYYIFVCWLARIDFIATPMGSDILVRPDESNLYKFFSIRSLLKAKHITGDSYKMSKKIKKLTGRDIEVIQNGVDLKILKFENKQKTNYRTKVVSLRALASNYRILDILNARNSSIKNTNIDFIYPFHENQFMTKIKRLVNSKDIFHGFLNKNKMNDLISNAYASISIPLSDSSPRTVYEAIFLGSIVIVTYDDWIKMLTDCMKKRIIIVDLKKSNWLKNALIRAKKLSLKPYIPSKEAYNKFDQITSMKIMCKKYYELQ